MKSDESFEQDVRASLRASAPRQVPEDLVVRIAAIPVEERKAVSDIIDRLYRCYLETDAMLIEVNPLALCGDGRLKSERAAPFRWRAAPGVVRDVRGFRRIALRHSRVDPSLDERNLFRCQSVCLRKLRLFRRHLK